MDASILANLRRTKKLQSFLLFCITKPPDTNDHMIRGDGYKGNNLSQDVAKYQEATARPYRINLFQGCIST
jgi:hypothetical protein